MGLPSSTADQLGPPPLMARNVRNRANTREGPELTAWLSVRQLRLWLAQRGDAGVMAAGHTVTPRHREHRAAAWDLPCRCQCTGTLGFSKMLGEMRLMRTGNAGGAVGKKSNSHAASLLPPPDHRPCSRGYEATLATH